MYSVLILVLVAVLWFGNLASEQQRVISQEDPIVGGIVPTSPSSSIIKDGDDYFTYIDEYVWNIGGLTRIDQTTIVNDGYTFPLVYGKWIGVENDFQIDDYSDDPAGIGDCYSLPNDYIKICFERLTINDLEYDNIIIELVSGVDFTEAGFPTWTSEPAVMLRYTENDGLILLAGNLDGLTSDVNTDRVYLYHNDISLTRPYVFYKDNSGDMRFAGRIINWDDGFLTFDGPNYGKLQFLVHNNDVDLLGLNLRSVGDYVNEFIYTNWSISSGKFSSLGRIYGLAEYSEIRWKNLLRGKPAIHIGAKDEDHRSTYGVIIKNPKFHGEFDEIDISIPLAQVKSRITILGPLGVGTTKNIPLGASLIEGGFDAILDDADIPGLQNTQITFDGQPYQISELLVISADRIYNYSIYPQTSLTSSDDDYESGVFLEVSRDAINYYYSFDEPIDITSTTQTNPLIINFLGKQILVQSIVSDTEMTIGYCGDGTCSTGESLATCSFDCGRSGGGSPLRIKTIGN